MGTRASWRAVESDSVGPEPIDGVAVSYARLPRSSTRRRSSDGSRRQRFARSSNETHSARLPSPNGRTLHACTTHGNNSDYRKGGNRISIYSFSILITVEVKVSHRIKRYDIAFRSKIINMPIAFSFSHPWCSSILSCSSSTSTSRSRSKPCPNPCRKKTTEPNKPKTRKQYRYFPLKCRQCSVKRAEPFGRGGYHREAHQRPTTKPKKPRTPIPIPIPTPIPILKKSNVQSSKRPLRPPLDKLIHQRAQVRQHEAADVKREKLRRVPDAELQPHVRLRAVLQARVFDLAGDLV